MGVRKLAVIVATLGVSICRGQGSITTIAGTGTCCADVDGAAATSAYLQGPDGLVMDKAGNLYIWETQPSRVRKVNPLGIISTYAGNGTPAYAGDGGPAINASLFASSLHAALAMDSAGNLYISDGANQRIRKVDTNGIITTVAGNGTSGFSGDGGPAINAVLADPNGLAVDSSDNLYICDSSNHRIRKINAAGIITTVAGNGNVVSAGDGGQAIAAAFDRPRSITFDSNGNYYFSEGKRIRKVNTAGIISTYAGTGTFGFSGDGGPAVNAQIYGTDGMAMDKSGNLYIADITNQRVRKIDAAGIITTIAGNTLGFGGDGGPAASALLATPHDVILDTMGNLLIADTGNHRIRKITLAAAALNISPTSLAFTYSVGGALPQAQTVNVTASGDPVGFTAAASTTSGGNWLTVTSSSATTPSTLTVSVTPTGLPGGAYSGSITLTPSGAAAQSFAVTLTVSGAGAPVITPGGIVNSSGYQTKLAPDTVFTVFGSGMGPASIATAAAPNYPTTLGGTSITFTNVAGGDPIDAKVIYSIAGQVAGLLPSSITPGTYAVRVTYNTLTSAPQNVTVVARSFGIATANSAGTGNAQATIGNLNGGLSLVRLTSGSLKFGGHDWALSPAHPRDTLVFWGTGGGADPANDTGGTSGDQTKSGGFTVNVGGRVLTPVYAGASSGYPGLWQINFTLPADIAPGCFVNVQVTAGGEVSNSVIIAVASPGAAECSDPLLSTAALKALDSGGTVKIGGFAVARGTNTFYRNASPGGPTTITTGSQENIPGVLYTFTAAQFAAIYGLPKIDACTISDVTGVPAPVPGTLDLGPNIPVSGPGLAAGSVLAKYIAHAYDLLLTNGTVVNGGTYLLAGTGGAGGGPFNASVKFPTSFTATNWDAITAIDRTQPLTINWTGGDEQVFIIISSSRVVGKDASNVNIIHNVAINCQVPAPPGTYTVPAAALAYLLPETIEAADLATGSGQITVEGVNSKPFTLPLVAGGQADYAAFQGVLSVSKNLVIR
jgi:uncharacterized protein (TIGR03437 family)